MPRLSMWNRKKGHDFYFMDRVIAEQFEVGGTGIYVHKYVGPQAKGKGVDAAEPDLLGNPDDEGPAQVDERNVQDLLFMENRDRKYDPDIYEMRGIYNVSDNDFDLTQFGLFLTNDTLFMTVHINRMVEILNRKIIPGDVIEMPHLLDELSLDPDSPPIPKFYVVSDTNRGGEGFSQTWYPHIWRIKLSPMTDSQEYTDILGTADQEDSLKNIMSTYQAEMDISDAIVDAAEQYNPDNSKLMDHLYGVQAEGEYEFDESIASGNSFPENPNQGDYYIRTDFSPKRLFVRRGNKWQRLYDNVTGKTWSDKTYNAGTFINNPNTTIPDDNNEIDERTALSKTIPPKSDN